MHILPTFELLSVILWAIACKGYKVTNSTSAGNRTETRGHMGRDDLLLCLVTFITDLVPINSIPMTTGGLVWGWSVQEDGEDTIA